ncbi:hypothetical protein PBI_PEREGRIN_150 [Rhodococcus phage Peregrin]|nr:hypothetical protein PBI_PEREGRIN_150 [Rhodococcus phage Peregrin]
MKLKLDTIREALVKTSKKVIQIDTKYGLSVWVPFGTLQFHEHYDWEKRFGVETGRCKEKELRIPIGKYALELATPTKSYLKLVDGPDYLNNTSWILDEFDSSFNDLAISSLKYHLDFSICDNSDRREKYEDIIARLGEDEPNVVDTPEKQAIWDEHYGDDTFGNINKEKPEALREIFNEYRKRTKEHFNRQQQARHDFVDIMPELWS